MAINLQSVLFFMFSVIALGAAIMMILHRNPVYSAIFLIVALFALAGFYVLLQAPFVASVHVIVYAGAIMVLFLFVIMLLNLKQDPSRERGRIARRAFASVIVAVLLAEMGVLIGGSLLDGSGVAAAPLGASSADGSAEATSFVGGTAAIGRQLFTNYILPFEIASVLLLVGIVGAVILAKRKLTS